jgi:hypothetical protein
MQQIFLSCAQVFVMSVKMEKFKNDSYPLLKLVLTLYTNMLLWWTRVTILIINLAVRLTMEHILWQGMSEVRRQEYEKSTPSFICAFKHLQTCAESFAPVSK